MKGIILRYLESIKIDGWKWKNEALMITVQLQYMVHCGALHTRLSAVPGTGKIAEIIVKRRNTRLKIS